MRMMQRDQAEIGRTRSLYLDFSHSGPYPSRGDEVNSGKTLYLVLSARKVRRRDPSAAVRIQMRVIRLQDAPEGLRDRLHCSAVRGRGQSSAFSFTWHKREKRRMTFERYMDRAR
jgi:hypothetical protein